MTRGLWCVALLVSFSGWSPTTSACPVLPEAEQIEHDLAVREELAEAVRALTAESTQIFVGRVIGVHMDVETRRVSGEPGEVRVYRPTFELIEELKGQGASVDGLYWEEEVGRVSVGCSLLVHFNRIYLSETYRYIVYVIGRRIARAAYVQDWPYDLTSDEEIALVQESNGS